MIRPMNSTQIAPAAPVITLPKAVPNSEIKMTGLRPIRSLSRPSKGAQTERSKRERGEKESDRGCRGAKALGVDPQDRGNDAEPDEVERDRGPDHPESSWERRTWGRHWP